MRALEPLGPRRDDDLVSRGDRDPVGVGGDAQRARTEAWSQLLAPRHLDAGRNEAGRCGQRLIELVDAGRIRIDPWDPGLVQPASVDLRLGDSFRVFHNHRATAIDLLHPPENLTEEVTVRDGDTFVIHPGEFCLGRTLEWVELPAVLEAVGRTVALSITGAEVVPQARVMLKAKGGIPLLVAGRASPPASRTPPA